MKNLFFVTATLVALVLIGCNGGTRTTSPKVFNDTLIKTFQGASKTLDEFDAQITAGVKSNELANIANAAAAALADLDGKIEVVNSLNATNGEDYKAAVLKCLEVSKEIVETGKKYAALPEGYSKSEFNALEKEYNAKRSLLSNELQNVGKAAAEYAKSVK